MEHTKKANVAVVTTFYKPFSMHSEDELHALEQMKSILKNRDLFFMHPESIDPREFTEFMSPVPFHAIPLSDRYFGSLSKANIFLMGPRLYNHLKAYDHILIYHTDAFVFDDELDYWCSLNIDYIGPPWFIGNEKPVEPFRFKGVGNGGFSLRRTQSFIRISNNILYTLPHLLCYRLYRLLEGQRFPQLRRLLGINYILKALKPHIGYEDEYWGMIVPRYFKWFKVAAPEDAVRFSFEVLPEELYRLNNYKLPFGCHAWTKYGKDFWKSHIYKD